MLDQNYQQAQIHSPYQSPAAQNNNLGLADNMIIEKKTPNQVSARGLSKEKDNKLVMQVNKYIPHYMRIPAKLQNRDLKIFQHEVGEDERQQKISPYVMEFDRVLFETILGNREKRYKEIFQTATQATANGSMIETNDDATETLFDRSQIKSQKNQRGKKSEKDSKNNFSNITAKQAGYDSDEERENAHSMFIDDI